MRALMLCCALVLTGCAGLDPYARPAGQSGQPGTVVGPDAPPAPGDAPPDTSTSAIPEPAVPDAAPSAPLPGPAAAHLLTQARALVQQGELDRAAAQVERALRIERSSPWLYLALADIRVAQGDTTQAAALGRRARALSQGDPAVLDAVMALPQPGAGGTPR